jgi:hypothetical protein
MRNELAISAETLCSRVEEALLMILSGSLVLDVKVRRGL